MPYSEKELVSIGSRFTTQRLMEQGAVSVALARAHEKELAKRFPPARTAELDALLADIHAKFSAQAEAKAYLLMKRLARAARDTFKGDPAPAPQPAPAG